MSDAPQHRRIAVFGGVYSNAQALTAMLDDGRRRDVDAVYCLGDVGGFGPHPDRVYPLLREAGVRMVQGNYDLSIAEGRDDCGCGYIDPRDTITRTCRTSTRSPGPRATTVRGSPRCRRRGACGWASDAW